MIVNTCPYCQLFSSPNVPAGVVCRGLTACQLWQTDCCVLQLEQKVGEVQGVLLKIDGLERI